MAFNSVWEWPLFVLLNWSLCFYCVCHFSFIVQHCTLVSCCCFLNVLMIIKNVFDWLIDWLTDWSNVLYPRYQDKIITKGQTCMCVWCARTYSTSTWTRRQSWRVKLCHHFVMVWKWCHVWWCLDWLKIHRIHQADQWDTQNEWTCEWLWAVSWAACLKLDDRLWYSSLNRAFMKKENMRSSLCYRGNLFTKQHQSANENIVTLGSRAVFFLALTGNLLKMKCCYFCILDQQWWTGAVWGARLKKSKGHQLQAVGASVVVQT